MFTKQSQRRRSAAALTMTWLVGLSLILGALPGRAQAQDPFDALVQNDFEFAARQLNTTLAEVGVDRYPSTTRPDGTWNTTDASDWTSGFFPGSLWLMYQRTGAAAWQAAATARQAGIEGQKTDTSTHDVGFKIFTSFGNGYRLTNDTTYRQVVLAATGALRLRVGSTTIGESDPLAITPAFYRVGLHQKRGTGANAVLEAFFAPASASSFGTPFAATTTGAWTTQANRLRFGATNGQTINAAFDQIILDAAAMPGP